MLREHDSDGYPIQLLQQLQLTYLQHYGGHELQAHLRSQEWHRSGWRQMVDQHHHCVSLLSVPMRKAGVL